MKNLLITFFLLLSLTSIAQPGDPSGDPDTTSVRPVTVKDPLQVRRIKEMISKNPKYIVRDREAKRESRKYFFKRGREAKIIGISIFIAASLYFEGRKEE